jgi:hypothetical protein
VPNIRRYFGDRGIAATGAVDDHVAGSMAQAEGYFQASAHAPLDIRPLLLYYGATSLLSGVAALLKGAPPPIKHHGMTIEIGGAHGRVSEVKVLIRNTHGGGLGLLAEVFGVASELPSKSEWSVGELLASLPDLKDDVHLCVSGLAPYALRLDVVRKIGFEVERVSQRELAGSSVEDVLSRIKGFATSYLQPQASQGGILLLRKVGGLDLTTESLAGQRTLLLGHDKNGSLRVPGQLLTMLTVLYALGMISRYNPTLWQPFVRTDATGELLLIERFLALASRWLPNLALSAVDGRWIRFTSEIVRSPQGMEALSKEDLKLMIREAIESKGA